MASKASIWNLAVGHLLGTAQIQSTAVIDTNEKYYLNKFYDTARKVALEEHDWRFATIIGTLSEVTGTPPDSWAYQYTYPSDCLVPREIVDARTANRRILAGEGYYPEAESYYQGRRPIPYVIFLNAAKDGKLICTDQMDAKLRYTVDIDSESLFPESFALALSFKLAEYVALPMTGNPELKTEMEKEYTQHVNKAMTSDSNLFVVDMNYDADFIKARE